LIDKENSSIKENINLNVDKNSDLSLKSFQSSASSFKEKSIPNNSLPYYDYETNECTFK